MMTINMMTDDVVDDDDDDYDGDDDHDDYDAAPLYKVYENQNVVIHGINYPSQ